jgi:hypothetical protein
MESRKLIFTRGKTLTGAFIKHFIVQLKNVELLTHFEIKEAAPTCFGLQGNHH